MGQPPLNPLNNLGNSVMVCLLEPTNAGTDDANDYPAQISADSSSKRFGYKAELNHGEIAADHLAREGPTVDPSCGAS